MATALRRLHGEARPHQPHQPHQPQPDAPPAAPKRRGTRSLTVWAVALFAVATLLPLAATLVQSSADGQAAEVRAFADAQTSANGATVQMQELVHDVFAAAGTVLSDSSFWEGDDETRDAILTRLAASRPEFGAVGFYTDDLQQHGSSTHLPGGPRADLSSPAYALEVVATGRPAFADEALFGLSAGVPVLPVAVPVRDGRRPGATGVAGLIVVGLRLERLPAAWSALVLPAGSAVALVDLRQGRILAGSGPAGARTNERIVAEDLERGRRGERAFSTVAPDLAPAGQARLRAWAAVAETPWAVVVDVPAATVLAPVVAVTRLRILVALALALVVLAPLLLLWRRLAEGLGRLVAATEPWAAGDWAHRTGVRGRDEVGLLGEACDRMAAQLEATGRELAVRRRESEAELARAARLQADLLPHEAPTVPGLEVAARCLPARQIGGDFFDWREPAPGVLTITLGDVMGKGLFAALLMATVRGALDTVVERRSPARTLEAIAAATELVLERAGAFVTLFHARAEAATPRVTYADAGHGHAFVRRAGGAIERLSARGLPLGAFLGQQYPVGTIDLAPGDALVVYSDGLIDARPDLVLTPEVLAARLDGAGSAAEIVERLTSLADTSHDLPDDLTVIVLCRRTLQTA